MSFFFSGHLASREIRRKCEIRWIFTPVSAKPAERPIVPLLLVCCSEVEPLCLLRYLPNWKESRNESENNKKKCCACGDLNLDIINPCVYSIILTNAGLRPRGYCDWDGTEKIVLNVCHGWRKVSIVWVFGDSLRCLECGMWGVCDSCGSRAWWKWFRLRLTMNGGDDWAFLQIGLSLVEGFSAPQGMQVTWVCSKSMFDMLSS